MRKLVLAVTTIALLALVPGAQGGAFLRRRRPRLRPHKLPVRPGHRPGLAYVYSPHPGEGLVRALGALARHSSLVSHRLSLHG